ncbi:MAG TPA: ABC transporter permease [Thermotogota bacterium]|nr:ABC transporter permease [Thermotogota bacterium]HRW92177.1 ABC transporter permease [Thermotogota bacterium]
MFSVAGLGAFFVERFSYIMEKMAEHLFIFIVSWIAAVAVGLLIGIIVTRPGKEKVGQVILAITGAAQAVPSIAVIALVFLFMGIGPLPALFSLFLYSLVPIVFNTASGLLNVSPAVKEAAKGMGLTPLQILFKIEIPNSIPAILSGVRTAAIINIGTATIAPAIGAGGLGEIIFIGLRLMDGVRIMAGAIPVAILAILVDFGLGFVERWVNPKGLQISKTPRT